MRAIRTSGPLKQCCHVLQERNRMAPIESSHLEQISFEDLGRECPRGLHIAGFLSYLPPAFHLKMAMRTPVFPRLCPETRRACTPGSFCPAVIRRDSWEMKVASASAAAVSATSRSKTGALGPRRCSRTASIGPVWRGDAFAAKSRGHFSSFGRVFL